MMSRSLSVIAAACAAAFFFCADNPAGPKDTSNSLWHAFKTAQDIPDTLYYGDEVTCIIAVGDSDGSPVTASVSGLPSSAWFVSQTGDTALITLTLTGDSLQYDSLYTISIIAHGGSTVDAETFTYAVQVIDSTRLGGLRTLAVGMWWRGIKGDTLEQKKDSANTILYTYDTTLYHTFNTVTGTQAINGGLWYVIESWDTCIDSGTVRHESKFFQHTAQSEKMLISINSQTHDTASYKLFELPLRQGNSWEMFDTSIDTAVRIAMGALSIPLLAHYGLNAGAGVFGAATYRFDGRDMSCFEVDDTLRSSGRYIVDTTIVLLADTIVTRGDTVAVARSTTTTRMYLSPDLSIPLWSSDLEVALDSNSVSLVVQHSAKKSGTVISAYFDPRANDTLALGP